MQSTRSKPLCLRPILILSSIELIGYSNKYVAFRFSHQNHLCISHACLILHSSPSTSCCSQSITVHLCKGEVKCNLVHTLRLCTGRTAHRGSRRIALLFLDHGTRRGEGSASRPGRSLPPEKTRCTLYRSLGRPQGRSGHVPKISLPTGIRSPDRPTRSQRLYRLSYPAHIFI